MCDIPNELSIVMSNLYESILVLLKLVSDSRFFLVLKCHLSYFSESRMLLIIPCELLKLDIFYIRISKIIILLVMNGYFQLILKSDILFIVF